MAKNARKLKKTFFSKTGIKLKQSLAVIKCEVCGKYFHPDEMECHHSVIPMTEIVSEYRHGKLSMTDAKEFARSRENLIILCHECHKKIHKGSNSKK